ncbi:MAG: TldD/PmbA family protein [Alphaproteobacteria bacterium]|nr:TldD/PmbA family protein [Alphaproteobacteria bacterium]MCB9691301.1 TldD/PmbA family protein [Alphaproteobacteria bacterium]
MLLVWMGVAQADPVIDLLAGELERADAVFSAQEETPHYTALTITETRQVEIGARAGTLDVRTDETERTLDVDLRVGTPTLDSTHPLRGFSALDGDSRRANRLPDDLGGYATRHILARELDARYREAAERIVVLRANQNVMVEEEDQADDFEPRKGEQELLDVPELTLDQEAWVKRLVALSERADASPHVHQHSLRLSAVREVKRMADTEGARLRHGRTHARLAVQLETTADDGDRVRVFDAFDVHDPADVPTGDLDAWVDAQVERLEALRSAPRGEPYSGPVMLEGRASGVFFHEVLGHRVEGHRQKREDEGKTFADHVGQPILPPWVDVVDDPTLSELAGVDLNGHYAWDDEGVRGQPAVLVDDGVFTGFLMARSPLPTVPHSNGHGRRSTGREPVARMGNTVVTTAKPQPRAALRAQLLELVKKEGLPYGYIVEDIEGGFALTGRMMPNAFNIRAVASWRVWADGRKDELVRGIDLVGTPFVAFSNLVATGDDPQVFNGTCGAESGWVPVSAVSPSILFSRLEFQLKEKAQQRPPLLPKPMPDDGSAEASP